MTEVPPGLFCVWADDGERWKCERCGALVPKSVSAERPFAGCAKGMAAAGVTPTEVVQATPREAPKEGAGTELHRMLANWFGIVPSATCPCRAMASKMNLMGPDWCESDSGMAEIITVMKNEHARRRQAGETIFPWTEIGARQLVRRACRVARKNSSKPKE